MVLVVCKVVDSIHEFPWSEEIGDTHIGRFEDHLHLLVVYYGLVQLIIVLWGNLRFRKDYVSAS
jgi:hypothetical protein